jgi:hypothetical protein
MSAVTVEEYLKSHTLSLASSITTHSDSLIASLQDEWKNGKRELMRVHKDCVNGVDRSESSGDKENVENVENAENVEKKQRVEKSSAKDVKESKRESKPAEKAATTAAPPTTASKGRQAMSKNLKVTVSSGPHESLTTTLLLKVGKTNICYIGRSSGKKFTNNGISLNQDLEVSTTHGNFSLSKVGKVYYTDCGSTNGSFVKDKKTGEFDVQLDEGAEYEVVEGGGVRCGASVLGWKFE